MQIQVIKQAVDVNAHESFDGQANKVLYTIGFTFLELVLVFIEIIFRVEGESFLVIEKSVINDDPFGFENAYEVVAPVLKSLDKGAYR